MLNLIHVCATIGAVMKMEKLYGNIRVNRKSLHLTQQELAERMGYERSSIAKIERGDVDLPLSKIRAFAEQFELPFSELLGLGTAEAQREIDLLYDALNAEGRSELVRYGQKLSRNGAFSLHALRYIRHYTTAAAAGYAAPIEGEDYELLPCGDDVPDGADYCIDIDGDSMEPYIRSGQRVYVARDESLKDFDAGIFFVDGDVYCKQWHRDSEGTTHLLSANPEREDASLHITADSGQNVVFFGKVLLGKKLSAPSYW